MEYLTLALGSGSYLDGGWPQWDRGERWYWDGSELKLVLSTKSCILESTRIWSGDTSKESSAEHWISCSTVGDNLLSWIGLHDQLSQVSFP